MQVLRDVDPARVRMDFLVLGAGRGDYDAEIQRLGSRVIPCLLPPRSIGFPWRLRRVLAEEGPYDVVHSHVLHFSGLVLALAARAGVPVRIAHAHMDSTALDRRAGAARRMYLAIMKAAVRRNATHGFAVSDGAARALFGGSWREDARFRVVRCGLDFSAYRAPAEIASIRAELGVPRDAVVLGHVGRFDEWKNQAFLLPVLAAARRREPKARLVLVGEGPLRGQVAGEARRLGLEAAVVFTGLRPDVPRLLRAFDVFVFPSVYEGLPLAGLEAQAAGLPLVMSDHLTRELTVLPELFTWVPLSAPPDAWAEAALASARRGSAGDAVSALERSEFSLARSVSGLLDAYGASR